VFNGGRVSRLRPVVAIMILALLLGAVPALEGAAPAAAAATPKPLPPLDSATPDKQQPQVPEGDFNNAPKTDGSVGSLPSDGAPGNFDPTGRTVIARDARTTTYDNHDGTSTTLVHATTVNWRDGTGTWRAINPRLTGDGHSRYHTLSTPTDASFSAATGGDDVVSVAKDGWSLGFRLSGQANGKAGSVTDNSIRYRDVMPGIDLVEQTTDSGLKEYVVLNRPPTRPASTFVFPLAVNGLTPSTQPDGSIAFADTTGATVLTVPPGFAQDSGVDPVTGSGSRAPASIKLLQPGPSTWAVQVSVDSAWLNDPARVYPVSVDPSVVFNTGLDSGHWDSFASRSQPTSNFNSYVDTGAYNDYIGIPAAGQEYYTYEKYELTQLHGHHVTQAMWNGYFYSANTYTSNSFAIYQAAGSWTDSTLTWNNQPGHTTYTPALGSTSAPNQWVPAVDITGWVQGWVDNSAVNYGVSIDTRGQGYYFKLAADEQAWAQEDSYLTVTFDDTAPTWPSQASQVPANGSTVMSSTPTLSVPAQTDAEGDAVQYWFRVATVDDAETGQALNSGWITTPSWTVPAGALQNGVTYYWKVFTWDGWGTSIPPTRRGRRRLSRSTSAWATSQCRRPTARDRSRSTWPTGTRSCTRRRPASRRWGALSG
jgi:hypothetical protein